MQPSSDSGERPRAGRDPRAGRSRAPGAIGRDPGSLLARVLDDWASGAVAHVERLPARDARSTSWPAWAQAEVVGAFRAVGIDEPWVHQREAAELAYAGRSVVLATGTASGKSLAFWLPAITEIAVGREAWDGRGATALYLAPTKALAGDQLRAVDRLAVPGLRVGAYDGDTPREERDWVRAHASYVLTNPDMLNVGILPAHERWSGFLRSLRYVVVDEAHAYRGVFGAHVAQVLRRLRRVCAAHGSDPVFVLASATTANPAESAKRLVGTSVVAVDDDGSPRGEVVFALLAPDPGADPVRVLAGLLGSLVMQHAQTVAFVRSRRQTELVAERTRARLAEEQPGLEGRVAAYRGGYLPEERRALEAALHDRSLLAVASTNALELGIDIAGLDAVVLGGYPGTRASLWQQVGRAGRSGRDALAVLVARDEPLDRYLTQHPEVIFGQPVEEIVFDPDNPYVLAPHLAAAAAELPLRAAEFDHFGPSTAATLDRLTAAGVLRRRVHGWYWTSRDRAADQVDLRGGAGPPVQVVEAATGRVVGTVDAASADRTVHDGAVYVHQGTTYVVDALDLDSATAMVSAATPGYTTSTRERGATTILGVLDRAAWGHSAIHLGEVEVRWQVRSYVRRAAATGAVLSEEPLDLPVRTLRTVSVWWTIPASIIDGAGVTGSALGGALHAAEHAAIGLLPLFATCDRWDIGGLSHPAHPDTGLPTIFVHDAHPGGAGFAERGFHAARAWLAATRDTILACPCDTGCPACIQSPKCGNGNSPLDKAASGRLLERLLAQVE